MVKIGEYHDKEKEKEFYEWLMFHVSTKVEGEKLLSLHHPFDTQINEAMNNAVLRRCLENKVLVGSRGLKYI
jgi:calcineurin-like phosphoesterase family protein